MKTSSLISMVLFSALAVFAGDDSHTPRAQLLSNGQDVFRGWCVGCHGGYEDIGGWVDEGRGSPGSTPPLAYSDFFMAIRTRPIHIVLEGLDDSITVNGAGYHSHMPAWSETLTDYEIACALTYIRVALNDSTTSSCNPSVPDDQGFPTCVKTARSPSAIAVDSIGVWEVTAIRNGVTRVAGSASRTIPSSRSFRVTGGGSYVFNVPSGFSAGSVLRVVDAWGRTVWSARVNATDRAMRWNGSASNGRKVAPGMYVARFEGFRGR
ncbi:MAG TPA: cytochrome c [Fibrobacteria bacterium]|jgi:mono/diheme cytochrome c family protein|nr:cytochrome c [Fibrobacteria bacterium]